MCHIRRGTSILVGRYVGFPEYWCFDNKGLIMAVTCFVGVSLDVTVVVVTVVDPIKSAKSGIWFLLVI